MIRKTILAAAAIATLGAAALAPTSASAWGFKGGFHHGHHGHHGFHGPSIGFYGVNYVGPDCYWVTRYNKFGQPRMVKVCSW